MLFADDLGTIKLLLAQKYEIWRIDLKAGFKGQMLPAAVARLLIIFSTKWIAGKSMSEMSYFVLSGM